MRFGMSWLNYLSVLCMVRSVEGSICSQNEASGYGFPYLLASSNR